MVDFRHPLTDFDQKVSKICQLGVWRHWGYSADFCANMLAENAWMGAIEIPKITALYANILTEPCLESNYWPADLNPVRRTQIGHPLCPYHRLIESRAGGLRAI